MFHLFFPPRLKEKNKVKRSLNFVFVVEVEVVVVSKCREDDLLPPPLPQLGLQLPSSAAVAAAAKEPSLPSYPVAESQLLLLLRQLPTEEAGQAQFLSEKKGHWSAESLDHCCCCYGLLFRSRLQPRLSQQLPAALGQSL